MLRSSERRLLTKLNTPFKIQCYLDKLTYRAEDGLFCPLDALRDRKANCFDGALFAALALMVHGYTPMLMDLRAVRDDDHVLAVYKISGRFGSIAKSNYAGLRFREAVYRSRHELAMSYLEHYYNPAGEKTLREFSVLLDLRRYAKHNWVGSREGLQLIERDLDRITHQRLLSPGQVKRLSPLDPRSYQAGMAGGNPRGFYHS
ncbi:MAG: hypothetical protein K1X83_11950 [Oligoflexia bacterium]|nr:hypothetical protein [Oligoflexia bacterium]